MQLRHMHKPRPLLAVLKHLRCRSRGFGFITFATMDSVDAVMRMPHKVHDKPVEVKPAQPRSEASSRTTESFPSASPIADSFGMSPSMLMPPPRMDHLAPQHSAHHHFQGGPHYARMNPPGYAYPTYPREVPPHYFPERGRPPTPAEMYYGGPTERAPVYYDGADRYLSGYPAEVIPTPGPRYLTSHPPPASSPYAAPRYYSMMPQAPAPYARPSYHQYEGLHGPSIFPDKAPMQDIASQSLVDSFTDLHLGMPDLPHSRS
jgi:hypothetical protein